MDWEELDTNVWKNFITALFFKLVSSVERRELCIANEVWEEIVMPNRY